MSSCPLDNSDTAADAVVRCLWVVVPSDKIVMKWLDQNKARKRKDGKKRAGGKTRIATSASYFFLGRGLRHSRDERSSPLAWVAERIPELVWM